MTIKGVLLRFLLLYPVLVITAGAISNYFGVNGGTAMNIAILAACVFWVCTNFGNKNKRYFSGRERLVVVLGIIAIDFALQSASAAAVLHQSPAGSDAGALVFGVGFIGAIHAIAIYLFVQLAKKPLIREGVISG